MRSRQLESFIRVCELGSISKAALTLNIAQPAIGVQIRELEREFGVPLLIRSATGTHPTPAGLIFLDEAKFILRRLDEVKRAMHEAAGQLRRTVTLGLTPSLSGLLTSRLVERLRATFPAIELKLFEELSHVLIERVETGRLDVALAYSVPVNRRLRRAARLNEALCLITHPGSAFDGLGPVALRDIAAAELAMPNEGDLVRRLVTGTMTAHGLEPRVAFSLDSMTAIKDVVMRGLACAVLPHSAVSREVASGALVLRPVTDPPLQRTLYLVQPAGVETNGAAISVIRVIDELLGELGRMGTHFFSPTVSKPAPSVSPASTTWGAPAGMTPDQPGPDRREVD